jgi:hypothetical protein
VVIKGVLDTKLAFVEPLRLARIALPHEQTALGSNPTGFEFAD